MKKSIFETGAFKKHATIELVDGIYMRGLSLSKLRDVFKEFIKMNDEAALMADNDVADEQEVEAAQAKPLDFLFNALVVGEDGTEFKEFEGNSVVDLFPMSFIMEVVNSIGTTLNPSPKE